MDIYYTNNLDNLSDEEIKVNNAMMVKKHLEALSKFGEKETMTEQNFLKINNMSNNEVNADKLLKRRGLEAHNKSLEKMGISEKEPMTESEIIQEISMITKEITKHRVEIRNLENELYKLEDLLEI